MSYQLLLFDFHGRISRKWFWIATMILSGTTAGWGLATVLLVKFASGMLAGVLAGLFVVSQILFPVLVCVACLSVQTKRWHDRGKSGWWILLLFVPVVGVGWALGEIGFLPGTDGPNRYGPDPRVDPRAALDGI
ncbi:DUF805 domain-containing protein [Aureimonas pseudogalii]|uniref:Uncharacterized membrane protein YhaH (DUF805 family) n=1 Tax=Aureimonas pseudogalii TaxID=1744844 RepID=A0A7W6EDR7_9HYPH|nr:DUF805 domain-containing protein [Aureimonas pseudogalii]MBB3996343.1 uncharacterized membrane protein YhaH (DUF805 family) [Aureimonas pseudogalii]